MKNLSNFLKHAVLAVIVSLTCQAASSARAATYHISMTSEGFVPDYLEVKVGDRVYWWNDDYDYYDFHSTRSYSYAWNSGPLDVGEGVYLDMTKTGSFDYVDEYGYIGWGTVVVTPAGPPPPPFISAPNRVDMVYDAGRDILYITSGSTVLRYQLASESFLTPFQLSGNLMGIDLSPDGNTLLVADSSANSTNVWVHEIDLRTANAKKVLFPIAFREIGTFAVAFGNDGAALISSRFGGSGWVPLRRYAPATGMVTTIGSIRHDSMVSSSGDGSTIIVAESDISSGTMDLYDVATRTITKTGGTGNFNYECAASRDGSLFALPTDYGTFVYNRNFNQITNFAGQRPIGAAFHPAADAVFLPFANTPYVRAYDTTTWEMLAEYNFENTFADPGHHAFVNGRTRISPDGQVIFVTVSDGVRYLRHGLNVPLVHRLVVAGNPARYGQPGLNYGTYWMSHGVSVTLVAPAYVQTNGTTFISSGWTGTGSAAGSGTTTTTTFTLTENSTLTWNWTPFNVSAHMVTAPGGKQISLQWPSVAGTTYDVLWTTNLANGFAPLVRNVSATPPNNSYESPNAGFFRVQMK